MAKTKLKKITTTLSKEYWNLKEMYGIKISEALRIGLAILFAERGQKQFQNPVNLLRAELLYKDIKRNMEDGRSSD